MKNLAPYNDDCFEVHKMAVKKKRDITLKNRLKAIEGLIETEYKTFDDKFSRNQLYILIPSKQLQSAKDDLLELYGYQTAVIRAVRGNIRNLQVKTIITTCQNCTIDTVNSLDHILPKSSFPEFVVNPRNLFPCCTSCNSFKLDSIAKGNKSEFLNLYLDSLPTVQYLFVDVLLDVNGDLDFQYRLENVNNAIDSDLFSKISGHFKGLHLFDRMKLKSIEYISEIENKITSHRHRLQLSEIATDLIDAAYKDKIAYGSNHWRCILEIGLLTSSNFMKRFT